MKKSILLVLLVAAFFMTACGSSDPKSKIEDKTTRTVEDLMDAYVKGYTTADIELIKQLYPPFYLEYAKDNLTKERLEMVLENAKEHFGDDFDVTYEITKSIKMTEEELKELNDTMKERYDTDDEAVECYKYEGTITFKGSKDEDTDPISTMSYFKYGDSWYIVGR